MSRRGRRANLRRPGLGALLAVGLWLAAEGLVALTRAGELRSWAAPPVTGQTDVHVLSGNPYLIYEYPPGTYRDGGVTVHVNSLGLRGPEVAIPKPAGVRRFLTTGDSSLFGFGVKDDEVFSTVAARRLGGGVEAVCGAVPGYSTFQTLNLLRMRALATDPDLFVLGNLWSDNNFDAFVDKEVLATYAGYEATLHGRFARLLSYSAIYRVLDWRLRVRDRATAIQKAGWMVGSGPQDGRRRVEIADYAQNLDTLARIALDRGADLVFVLPANREDMGASPTDTDTMAWDPYRRVMREAAARYGAPIVEVPAELRASGRPAAELFLDEMHPTATGHRLMGEALARLLEERGWAHGGRVAQGGPGGPVPVYVDRWLSPPKDGVSPTDDPDHRLRGTVVFRGYRRGTIILDAVVPGQALPKALSSTRLAAPGPFGLPMGTATRVTLRAYLDEDGDGLDPADRVLALPAVEITPAQAASVIVDLDAGTITPGG